MDATKGGGTVTMFYVYVQCILPHARLVLYLYSVIIKIPNMLIYGQARPRNDRLTLGEACEQARRTHKRVLQVSTIA